MPEINKLNICWLFVQLDSRQNSQTSLYLVTAVQVDVSLFVTRAFDLGFAAVKRRMGIV